MDDAAIDSERSKKI